TSGPMLEPVRAMGYEPEVFSLKGTLLQANTAVQVARMAALIRAEGIRIVHSTDFNTNLLGFAAARLSGAKSVISRLDLGHLRAGFGRWHRETEKLTARFADLVVTNADAVREVCIREEGVKPENCVVVRNGIDLESFDALAAQGLKAPLPVPDDMPTVAVIGNLWPVKGHRTLVEAGAASRPISPWTGWRKATARSTAAPWVPRRWCVSPSCARRKMDPCSGKRWRCMAGTSARWS